MILSGKRLLVTGALGRNSVAFTVAERAQLMGARVLLADSIRVRELTEHAAAGLPGRAPVIDLDSSGEKDAGGLAERIRVELEWIDGVLFPLGGVNSPGPGAFANLVAAVAPALGAPDRGFEGLGASLVALDFPRSPQAVEANPVGSGRPKASSVVRDLARDLHPAGHRVNLVSAGPPSLSPGADHRPVADVVCFLLSDLARAMTGGTVYADRGHHLTG